MRERGGERETEGERVGGREREGGRRREGEERREREDYFITLTVYTLLLLLTTCHMINHMFLDLTLQELDKY